MSNSEIVVTPEHLSMVFQFLQTYDIQASSRCCQIWRKATHLPSAWDKEKLNKSEFWNEIPQHRLRVNAKSLVRFSKHPIYRNINDLLLDLPFNDQGDLNQQEDRNRIADLARNFRHITRSKVELLDCDDAYFQLDRLIVALEHFGSKLLQLNINLSLWSTIPQTKTRYMTSLLSNLRSLQLSQYCGDVDIYERKEKEDPSALNDLTSLEKLSLCMQRWSKPWAATVRYLSSHHKLRSLTLTASTGGPCDSISYNNLEKFEEGFSFLSETDDNHLTHLHLEFAPSFKQLHYLTKWRHLQSITCDDGGGHDDELMTISASTLQCYKQNLVANFNMQTLNWRCVGRARKISNDVLDFLAHAWPNLTCLYLQTAYIQEGGLMLLCESNWSKSLTSLGIQQESITRSSGREWQGFARLEKLTTLILNIPVANVQTRNNRIPCMFDLRYLMAIRTLCNLQLSYKVGNNYNIRMPIDDIIPQIRLLLRHTSIKKLCCYELQQRYPNLLEQSNLDREVCFSKSL